MRFSDILTNLMHHDGYNFIKLLAKALNNKYNKKLVFRSDTAFFLIRINWRYYDARISNLVSDKVHDLSRYVSSLSHVG